MADITVNFAGIPFKTPVVVASGTFGFGREYGELLDLSLLGGICVKGLTLTERPGNRRQDRRNADGDTQQRGIPKPRRRRVY